MIDTWINLWERVVPKGPLAAPFCLFLHVNFTHTHTHTHCVYIYIAFQFHLIPFWPWCIDPFILFLGLRGSRETSSANPHHSQIFWIMTTSYIVCVCDNIRTTNHIHEKVLSCHPTSCVCDNIRTIRSILSHCATLQHKSLSTDAVDT
jgi:hypothetical protein